VQNSNVCSESGFACDFHDVNEAGEPATSPAGHLPVLEVGTLDNPIPAEHTARLRLHYFQGMNKADAPAIVCCSARMDFHGAPLSRTWLDLGADAKPEDVTIILSDDVTGWQVGDEVVVTGTMYHAFSQGSISYARFAHLGKEGVLGRYSIHFHLVGNTMRGSSVVGAAIVDSHNRWITVHGTNYMIVRDCVGYQSVGHGFFLEDGTEVYAVFDRNLGMQAYGGAPLPDQVMPFDPNDGAAFWWANGRNTFVRNTACQNNKYGFRYDSQKRSNFDSTLAVMMPDGKEREIDIRTIPFYRFEQNEAHTEGLYGMTFTRGPS
jgi:hypothetical protein